MTVVIIPSQFGRYESNWEKSLNVLVSNLKVNLAQFSNQILSSALHISLQIIHTGYKHCKKTNLHSDIDLKSLAALDGVRH